MNRQVEKPFEDASGGFFMPGHADGRYAPRHLPGAFVNVCRQHGLLAPGDRVLIACSGGLDSTTLLDLCVRTRERLAVTLGVAHFNHRLRGAESERDAAFVRELAETRDLAVFIGRRSHRRSPRQSVQMWARDCRYRFLERVARREGYDHIMTAHTLDDQAETILMNLLQGYPGGSLRGIPLQRGRYVRPLLGVSRASLAEYTATRGVVYVEDRSNASDVYLRNRVRHGILPLLQEACDPNIATHLANWGRYIADVEVLLDDLTAQAWDGCARTVGHSYIKLELRSFNEYFTLVKRRLIHRAVKSCLGPEHRVPARLLNTLMECVAQQRWGRRFRVSPELEVAVDSENLSFYAVSPATWQFPIVADRQHRFLNGRLRFASRWTKKSFGEHNRWDEVLYLQGIPGRMTLRPRQRGDRFHPFGMQETVRLSDYLAGRRIPRHVRDHVPLLVKGGTILWVCGVGISERVRVMPGNRRCLAVRCRYISPFDVGA